MKARDDEAMLPAAARMLAWATRNSAEPVGTSEPARASSRTPERLLLAAIHDATPRFADAIARLADLLDGSLGEARYAMLVIPNHWGDAPLDASPSFCRRLRAWADAGVEMFVHGYLHRDFADHQRAVDRVRGALLTANEGEFLGLDRAEAAARLRDGRRMVEDVIGRPAAGFVAPAWLYGGGAIDALRDEGFGIAESHFRVWEPGSDRTLARGPVVTWATRSRTRELSSLAWAGVARLAYRPLRVARVGLHPGDLVSPTVMASVERTLAALRRGRRAGRYADLLDPSLQAVATSDWQDRHG